MVAPAAFRCDARPVHPRHAGPRQGIVARHRHTGPVFAHGLKGRWHYLEHDWVAEEGGFAFEPPGETHTVVVPEGCSEMVTLFNVTGALIYVSPHGAALGYDDVFTRLEKTRAISRRPASARTICRASCDDGLAISGRL
jgi:hypothetical protein